MTVDKANLMIWEHSFIIVAFNLMIHYSNVTCPQKKEELTLNNLLVQNIH